jgi:hypothetical protein
VESGGHGLHVVPRGTKPEGELHAFVPASVHDAVSPLPGVASEPYRLLSLHDTLWKRRAPGARESELWTREPKEWIFYSGAREGRRGAPLGGLMAGSVYPGGVRPPWALLAAGTRGDWFLDPAFASVERHGAWFAGAHAPSRVYALNHYLDDLTRECAGLRCAEGPRPLTLAFSPVAFGLFLGLSFVAARGRRRAP